MTISHSKLRFAQLRALSAVVIFPALALSAGSALAGEAIVEAAKIVALGAGQYRVSATIRHDDSGWDHYADGFEVLAPDGALLVTRKLVHPHENEQPFTRSTNAFAIPPGTEFVNVRARENILGYGDDMLKLAVPAD